MPRCSCTGRAGCRRGPWSSGSIERSVRCASTKARPRCSGSSSVATSSRPPFEARAAAGNADAHQNSNANENALTMTSVPSAHVDTFARDHLPPRESWPDLVFDRPELQYPDRLNCAAALLDEALARGWGERTAIIAPDGVRWSYAALTVRANQLAHVLVDDLG